MGVHVTDVDLLTPSCLTVDRLRTHTLQERDSLQHPAAQCRALSSDSSSVDGDEIDHVPADNYGDHMLTGNNSETEDHTSPTTDAFVKNVKRKRIKKELTPPPKNDREPLSIV